MKCNKETGRIWYNTVGRIPIRVAIPSDLTLAEARAALEEFVGLLHEFSAFPNADKLTVGEAYKIASEERGKEHALITSQRH